MTAACHQHIADDSAPGRQDVSQDLLNRSVKLTAQALNAQRHSFLPACLPAYVPTCLPAHLPTCLPAYAYLPSFSSLPWQRTQRSRSSPRAFPCRIAGPPPTRTPQTLAKPKPPNLGTPPETPLEAPRKIPQDLRPHVTPILRHTVLHLSPPGLHPPKQSP